MSEVHVLHVYLFPVMHCRSSSPPVEEDVPVPTHTVSSSYRTLGWTDPTICSKDAQLREPIIE
jgi:hypothetical protein